MECQAGNEAWSRALLHRKQQSRKVKNASKEKQNEEEKNTEATRQGKLRVIYVCLSPSGGGLTEGGGGE